MPPKRAAAAAPEAKKKPAAKRAPAAKKPAAKKPAAKPAAPKRKPATAAKATATATKKKAPTSSSAAAAAKKKPAAAAKKPAAPRAAKAAVVKKKPVPKAAPKATKVAPQKKKPAAAAAAAKKPAAAAAAKAAAKRKAPSAPSSALPSLDCFTFGSNPFGALGLGEDVVEKFRPAFVPLPKSARCAQVACGGMHTLALSSDGRVFSWGVNDEGALGRPTAGSAWGEQGGGGGAGSTPATAAKKGSGAGATAAKKAQEEEEEEDPHVPGEVRLPAAARGAVVAVAAGDGVSVALTSAGDVWGWGLFKDDASGLKGFPSAAGGAGTGKMQRLPVLVYDAAGGGGGGKPAAAAASEPAPAAKKQKTAASSSSSSPPSSSPSSLGPIIKVACGLHHVAMLTRGGDVLTFGMAGQGQLGRVDPFDQSSRPPALEALLQPTAATAGVKAALAAAGVASGDTLVDVACGAYATYAVTKQGRVVAWGLNNAGQLALPPPDARAEGTRQFVWRPTVVPWFGPAGSAAGAGAAAAGGGKGAGGGKKQQQHKSKGAVSAVAGGEHHALAIMRGTGKVFAWGSPTYGMLGRADVDVGAGGEAKHPEPKEVDGAADGLGAEKGGAVAVAAGTNLSACVTRSGNLYLWGSNVSGQMAKGADDDDCEAPTRMRRAKTFGQRRIRGVAFGGQHAALVAEQEEEGAGALSP
jgi:regulator of chromosome condensation